MNDVRLHARDVGQGTPLILVHAFPLASTMWLAQRERLASRFHVITPDMRGFGGSPLGDKPPSIDTMADDLVAVLDAKGLRRAVIGGLSMGGYVTISLCHRYPDRVLGVVLANTKASQDPEAARASRIEMAGRLESEKNVAVLLDEVLPMLVGPTTMRQRAMVYGRVRGLVQATPPAAAAWAQRAMADRPEYLAALREIRAPTLIISGAEDSISSEEDAHAMRDALPNAELITIPRSGHLTAIEQPDLFNEAVAEFVAALSRI